MNDEQRRRLKLERHVTRAWLDGAPMATLPERYAVPIEWVRETLMRYSRGTLRLEPGQ